MLIKIICFYPYFFGIIAISKNLVKAVIISFLLFTVTFKLNAREPVKIMFVGNSITAGEHFGYPPVTERAGFRQPLYKMLVDSGYCFDFVGTQKHGERAITDTNWYDWNNEAFPGWKIPEIARKTNEALQIYFPDILLVHVGTNGSNWDEKPGEVMRMLDSVNRFALENDHDITVLLCKIINRFISQDQKPTTLFNTRLEKMVTARSGDKIKIIMVDMEKGAGLDYSDNLPNHTATTPYEGGDMWGTRYPGISLDIYHPNEKGNYKMAVKYYQELVKELAEPDKIINNRVEGVKVTLRNDTSLLITWTSNFIDEDGYIIERAEKGMSYTVLDTINANSFFYIDTSAHLSKNYKYKIKAFNSISVSNPSSVVTYFPDGKTSTNVEVVESMRPKNGSYRLFGSNAAYLKENM